MHLRLPSFDRGFTSFLWGIFFGLVLWLGMLSLDVGGATSFIFGALGGAAIFFYVRLFGGDDVRPPRA